MFTKIYKFLKAFALIASIAERGNIGSPIVVTKNGIVLDGNTRLRLAKKLGLEKIPVVFIDASEVQEVDPNTLSESY